MSGIIKQRVDGIFEDYNNHKNIFRLIKDLCDAADKARYAWQKNYFDDALLRHSLKAKCEGCGKTGMCKYQDGKFLCMGCRVLEAL